MELKSKGNEAKESICKSEFTVDKDKRIIVFTTNLLLKYLAAARGLSIDGTFKSTPKGWSQILIISAEICKDEWVPVVFIWLPDKCSYEMAFRLVKNLLDQLGLGLIATYCMMDFEIGMRLDFTKVFGNEIAVKGCHFHFGQSLWRFVVNNGMKGPYCSKGNDDLVLLIRVSIALAFVPLNKFKDAFEYVEQLSKQLKKKYRKFGKDYVDYLKKIWVNGNYPKEQWNFFMFGGASTNNVSEGGNRKFNNDSHLGPHPNAYKLCSWIKELLAFSTEEAKAIKQSAGSSKRKENKKYKQLKERREKAMKKVHKTDIDLPTFMRSVGAMTLHLDNRVTEALSENDNQNGSQVYNETEIFDLDSDADIPADAFNISNDDFEIPSEIPEITRNQREASLFAEALKTGILTEEHMRFHENVFNEIRGSDKELTMEEGWVLAHTILDRNDMEISPTQRDTPGRNH